MNLSSLSPLRFVKFEFIIETTEELRLPNYKGSALRGGFGAAFKKAACATKSYECEPCILKSNCSYYTTFESKVDRKTRDLLRIGNDAPHSFVLEPPLTEQNIFQKGEKLSYHLILIGRTIDFLPYFVYAFHFLGDKIGLGRGRGKFRLCEVKDCDGGQVYDGSTQKLKSAFRIFSAADFIDNDEQTNYIALRFLTPARLKTSFHSDGQHLLFIKTGSDFWTLAESLYHRIFTLTQLYCSDISDAYDSKYIYLDSPNVELTKSDLRWYDWERYSSRQDTRMRLGGFIGEAIFKGEIGDLVPLFKIGEYLHVGKGSSFGLGKYEIKIQGDSRR
ncbi:MAG: CRISPR system precrRNA processing endoribonuclease RAMP protein Cas6 [Thaumarchaeota archaeon]|nr:CRISPR system precrRNA processing endoribonuclease RAMP protein Cas6 [Nitrososphaerota archaeon]